MTDLDKIKGEIAGFAERLQNNPRKKHALKMWPETADMIFAAWGKAHLHAFVYGDERMAAGYLMHADEELSAMMDHYDDLASDPLP